MTEVENAPVHLTVSIRKDGVWLNFRASTGKHASLRIESLGEERRGIIGRALLDWCADQRADAPAQPPSKEWCEKKAQLEGDNEIGAGLLVSDLTQQRVRHKNRGSTYRVIGRGELQSSSQIAEGAVLVAYQCENDGRLWLRPATEFDDGRFEAMSDAPAQQTQISDEATDDNHSGARRNET